MLVGNRKNPFYYGFIWKHNFVLHILMITIAISIIYVSASYLYVANYTFVFPLFLFFYFSWERWQCWVNLTPSHANQIILYMLSLKLVLVQPSESFKDIMTFSFKFLLNSFTESSPRATAPSGDDWRSSFDASANGPSSLEPSRSNSRNTHGRRHIDPARNGDASSGSDSGSRRTPNRMAPPTAPQSNSMYRY